jgi:hypothetical protein
MVQALAQGCQNFGDFWKVGDAKGMATATFAPIAGEWARSTVVATNMSMFNSVATDAAGNIFAAGRRGVHTLIDFGGVSASGGHTVNFNMALVKYDPAGNAVWLKSVLSVSNQSRLSAVATDASGNVFVAGVHYGSGSFDYGAGALVSTNANNNCFIVKYSSAGTPLWSRSMTATPANNCEFNALATDSAGNAYAAGYVASTGSFNFNGQAVSGVIAGRNMAIVKYNASGTVVWARGVTSGTLTSDVTGLVFDETAGELIVVGQQTGAGTLNFNAVAITSPYAGTNAVIIRLNGSTGVAVSGRTVAAAANVTRFNAVAIGNNQDIYACGYQTGNTPVDYGGITSTAAFAGGNNLLVIKYDALLVPVWVRSVTTAIDSSECLGIAVSSAGFVTTAGFQTGISEFDYGGVRATGVRAGDNSAIVRFTTGGVGAAASSMAVSPDGSRFNDVAIDTSGAAYAVGHLETNGIFNYGGLLTVQGAYAAGENAVIVKYR